MGRRGVAAAIAIVACGGFCSCIPALASAQGTPPGTPQEPSVAGERGDQATAGQAKPSVVRVGALLNDIQQLELQTHSYSVDMYFWFKWDDPELNPPRSYEFLNAYELWGHIVTYETAEPERLPDGSWYQVLRVQGKFNAKLPLQEYPFDTQELLVEIEDSDYDNTGLIYKPDTRPIALSESITIPGWDIGEPSLTVRNNRYETDFGDPSAANPAYSRVVIALPVTRPKGTYALKLLLPMLLVALTAALALSVHPQFVEGRIGIAITALLTLVALQLTSNSSLPEVNYLLLLDKLYILSYAFVVLTIAVIVRNSWVDATGDVAVASRADRRGLIGLTIAYFVVAGILFLTSLT